MAESKMKTQLITSKPQLEAWLSENGMFEDSMVLVLDPMPSEQSTTPCSVILELALGGWGEAGQLRTIQVSRVTASGVKQWSLQPIAAFDPDNCVQGVDLFDSGDDLGITLDVPGELRLVCTELEICQNERKQKIEPWLDNCSMSAQTTTQPYPLPSDWIEWFKAHGQEVVWRCYGGESVPEGKVPRDSTGWFLQSPERLSSSNGGLFFYTCRVTGGEFLVNLQNSGVSDALWTAARRVLAMIPSVSILCGNCRFSKDSWLRHLNEGSLPEEWSG
ncbi:MAG: hypothetical protein WCB27_05105 [Thermoguttaceae bacterium]